LIEELDAVSQSVVPTRMEAVVSVSRVENIPFAIEWDAPIPMSDLLQDTSKAYLSGDPDDIGILIEGENLAWFSGTVDTYRAGVLPGAPSGIGILDESGYTSHLLSVRPVVRWEE
jgi:hypothetical protein